VIALVVYSLYNFIYLPSFGAIYDIPHYDTVYKEINIIFPDEGRFIRESIEIVDNGRFYFNESYAWEMPLTAVIYSFFYAVSDDLSNMIYAIRIFQSLLLIFQALLAYRLTKLIFKDEISGKIALLIYLFYPFFIFYQGLLLSETIFITLVVCAFYFFYRWIFDENSSIQFLIISHIFFVMALYTKGVISFFPIFLVTVTVLSMKNKSMFFKIKSIVFSVFLFVILMSPWWLRNYNIFNQFVPFTTSSTFVLYSGNNPMNISGGGIGGVDLKDIEGIEKLTEIEKMKLYKKEALNFIKDNPNVFLKNMYTKFLRFWRLYPYAKEFTSKKYIILSLMSYGVVLFFALIGLVKFFDKFIILLPIYLWISYMTFVHMVYISSIRYRLPIEPFLIIIASATLALLYHEYKSLKE
jgi:4-amino-4-deoxy-L-arabinose transferase-like glycosyltransferase